VLAKICEDVPDRMVADGSQPLDTILPKVFALLTAQNDKWRAYSLEIINRFIMLDPPVMQQNIQALLQAIFHLTGDPSAAVRKQVIIGINQLVEYRFSDVLPHMNGVIEFMLVSNHLVLCGPSCSESEYRRQNARSASLLSLSQPRIQSVDAVFLFMFAALDEGRG
jgi:hypothetical protein